MAQQLIFTSAVAGLNPGSSGYCTVARSESMRDAVVTRLEQWSVYTHKAGGQNPVVCAYRILNLRGSVFHVFTRIVDSGLDYTGRTNFLAHHLVFQPHEIHGACSPAEVFLQWPGWMNQWQGAPRYLEDEGLSLHNIPRSTKMPAHTWKEWAGDAGAATLLVTEGGGGGAAARSVDLVVPIGSEGVLPHLYAESLHLVDPKGENAPAAWGVTFTTFLQSQDDAGDFRWRGLSPENRSKATGETLIDFATQTFPPATSDTLAEYARSGRRAAAFLPGLGTIATASGLANVATEAVPNHLVGIKTSPSPRRIASPRQGGPPTAAREKIPLWVWICMAGIVPLGLVIGVWIARPSDRNSSMKPAPVPAATPPAVETTVASEPTPSPSTTPLLLEAAVKSSPAEPTPTPVSAAEAAMAQKQNEAIKLANQELAKLPDSPVYLTVGSVKSLKIPAGVDNPLGELLQAKPNSPDNGSLRIEVRFDNLRKDDPASHSFGGSYQDKQIDTTDELAYTFKGEEVTSTASIQHELVWLTLNSPGSKYARMNFIFANGSDSFNRHSFHLSRRLFAKDSNAPIFRISEAARQKLNNALNSWIGLEPFGDDTGTVRYALRAAFKNPVDGKTVLASGNQNFEVSFESVLTDAASKLKGANDAVKALENKMANEPSLQSAAVERQARLLKPSPILPPEFPLELQKDLSVDSYRVDLSMSGLQYYQKIHAWIKELAGDDNLYNDEVKGFGDNPSGGRFSYLRDVLRKINDKAHQQVAKEATPKPPSSISRSKKLLLLTEYLINRFKDSDEVFINDSSNPRPASSTNDLQVQLNDARQKEKLAEQQTHPPIDFGHVELWIIAVINKTPVHLIDFADDETKAASSSAQGAERTTLTP